MNKVIIRKISLVISSIIALLLPILLYWPIAAEYISDGPRQALRSSRNPIFDSWVILAMIMAVLMGLLIIFKLIRNKSVSYVWIIIPAGLTLVSLFASYLS